jgi:hypothetical protein
LLPSLLLAQGWVWVVLPQEQACLELKQWLGAEGRMLRQGWQQFQQQGQQEAFQPELLLLQVPEGVSQQQRDRQN